MKNERRIAVLVWALAIAISGCEQNLAERPAREHDEAALAAAAASAPSYEELVADPRDAPVPVVDGRPIWTANADRTAEENARAHFEDDGEAFGAETLEDYVAMVHAFTANPPPGAEVITRVSNGDRLIYDPTGNVFAVVTTEGAPRTMFKPDNGAEYWERQKEIEAGR
jgi:pyocin large subunit-like protein